MSNHTLYAMCAAVALGACGGPSNKPAAATTPAERPAAAPADPAAVYAPLDVGADYRSYHKVTKFAQISKTHGGRYVDIWVNDIAYPAYIDPKADVPVGAVIVKTSWEVENGKRTDVPGPIFVMQKREPGYAPDHDDWYYALHWEKVPPRWQKRIGATQVYWRSPSKKVDYCWGCHEDYLRELGMPKKEARTWE